MAWVMLQIGHGMIDADRVSCHARGGSRLRCAMQMCAIIDTAARLIAKHRFISAPPPFHALMGSHIRPFLLKPVRARSGTLSLGFVMILAVPDSLAAHVSETHRYSCSLGHTVRWCAPTAS